MTNTKHLGSTHTFTSRDNETDITLNAGKGETLVIDGTMLLSNANRVLTGYYGIGATNTPVTIDVWTKLLGTSADDTHNFNFTLSNNRATYTGPRDGILFFSFGVTLSTAVGNQGLFVGMSKNGADPDDSSVMTLISNAAGKIDFMASTCHYTATGVIFLRFL